MELAVELLAAIDIHPESSALREFVGERHKLGAFWPWTAQLPSNHFLSLQVS